MKKYKRAIVWLRRDLRLTDHTALARAAEAAEELVLVFVFDPNILKKLPRDDRRLTFIHQALRQIDAILRQKGSRLLVMNGDPWREIPKAAERLEAEAIFFNRDYEPYAKERDQKVREALKVPAFDCKDQVIFEGREILSQAGSPFKVFTPYKNAWLKALTPGDYSERKVKLPRLTAAKELQDVTRRWELMDLGFSEQKLWLKAGEKAAHKQLAAVDLRNYKKERDFPAKHSTSGLSAQLRFGTISIRECVRRARSERSEGAATWLSELIWRDFFQMILDQFPHVTEGAFRREYDRIRWPGSRAHFEAWKEGHTGYPLIDAAMKHFAATGWMHNRLRMVVASFLVKDLLCDWRWGERYFAEQLLDFDLAANNGGWQWAASTGCDAQPYFRIFNPTEQSRRFDPEGEFILSQLPELRRRKDLHAAVNPIVDHAVQRQKALALFRGTA